MHRICLLIWADLCRLLFITCDMMEVSLCSAAERNTQTAPKLCFYFVCDFIILFFFIHQKYSAPCWTGLLCFENKIENTNQRTNNENVFDYVYIYFHFIFWKHSIFIVILSYTFSNLFIWLYFYLFPFYFLKTFYFYYYFIIHIFQLLIYFFF